MRQIALLAFLALVPALLGGCAADKGRELAVLEPDPITLRLAEAADKASAALQTLAMVEQARTEIINIPVVDEAPDELTRPVSITWVGPIEPVAKRLAERVGYGFNCIGATPTIPVVINIDALQVPVIEVLRDIGLQAGSRAELAVDAQNEMVEVRYVSQSAQD
ncbi:MAG: DotD/TraH family lipoprotein [Pseudomonadota bacterium]|nr:DotD/TraH family lipoprotein [Pseudomonadota bacterium]